MYPDDESYGDTRERVEKNTMVPDELEMQIARAALAEERVAELKRTIDALVAALEDAKIDMVRFAADFVDDPALHPNVLKIDAALALARGGK